VEVSRRQITGREAGKAEAWSSPVTTLATFQVKDRTWGLQSANSAAHAMNLFLPSPAYPRIRDISVDARDLEGLDRNCIRDLQIKFPTFWRASSGTTHAPATLANSDQNPPLVAWTLSTAPDRLADAADATVNTDFAQVRLGRAADQSSRASIVLLPGRSAPFSWENAASSTSERTRKRGLLFAPASQQSILPESQVPIDCRVSRVLSGNAGRGKLGFLIHEDAGSES